MEKQKLRERLLDITSGDIVVNFQKESYDKNKSLRTKYSNQLQHVYCVEKTNAMLEKSDSVNLEYAAVVVFTQVAYPYRTFVSTLESFFEEVDHDMYPDITQEYKYVKLKDYKYAPVLVKYLKQIGRE